MAHIYEVRIAWGDCDEAGLVYYPNYFRWMDSAFHDLLRVSGLNHRELMRSLGARGVPLVESNARFLAPASYDELLKVKAEIAHWGTKSFRMAYKGFRDDVAIFEGQEARVWAVDSPDGAMGTAPIPVAFKEALAAHAGRAP